MKVVKNKVQRLVIGGIYPTISGTGLTPDRKIKIIRIYKDWLGDWMVSYQYLREGSSFTRSILEIERGVVLDENH